MKSSFSVFLKLNFKRVILIDVFYCHCKRTSCSSRHYSFLSSWAGWLIFYLFFRQHSSKYTAITKIERLHLSWSVTNSIHFPLTFPILKPRLCNTKGINFMECDNDIMHFLKFDMLLSCFDWACACWLFLFLLNYKNKMLSKDNVVLYCSRKCKSYSFINTIRVDEIENTAIKIAFPF